MSNSTSNPSLKIGDSVIVPDPTITDGWNHSFSGTIVDIHNAYLDIEPYATIEDQEGDCWAVNLDRLTLALDEDS